LYRSPILEKKMNCWSKEMKKNIVILVILLSGIYFSSGCLDVNYFFEPEVHVKHVTMDVLRVRYDPETIHAHMDDTIVIKLNGEPEENESNLGLTTHTFTIDEFAVNLIVEKNETVKTVFTPTKRGRFSFYCNIFCGEGHDEMKGLLIVE
jgi:plastocyanin